MQAAAAVADRSNAVLHVIRECPAARSRAQFRPPPVSIVTVDHLSVYHSRNRLFYKPPLRIIGEIPGAGGVRNRKGAIEAIIFFLFC